MSGDDSHKTGCGDNRIEGGRFRYVVQTGAATNVSVGKESPYRVLPAVMVSVALLVVAGAVWVSREHAPATQQPARHDAGSAQSPSGSAKPRNPAPRSPSASSGPRSPQDTPPTPRESSGKAASREAVTWKITKYRTTAPGPEVVGGEKCGAYSLCAYRLPGHQERFDFPAPDAGGPEKTCFSFPDEFGGFVSVVNGRRYTYEVYDKPRCTGKSTTVAANSNHQDFDFAFESYVKR